MTVTKLKVVPELSANNTENYLSALQILNLGTIYKQVVSSPYQLSYRQWPDFQYATRRRLGGRHSQFGSDDQKKSHPSSLITMLTELLSSPIL